MNSISKMKLLCQIFIGLLGILIPMSCTVEEDTLETMEKVSSHTIITTRSAATVNLPDDVFHYTDTRLTPIINALQTVENETHFMESFCEILGTPLWNYAEIEEDENQICYFVPLFHPKDSSQINSIWFFCIENNQINYMPIRRGDETLAENGQEFLFDALSCTVFGETDSKCIYRKQTAMTRAWLTVTSCWNVYTGPNMQELEYQYTECTDKTMWVDTVLKWHTQPDLPGSGSIQIGGGGGTINAQRIFANDRFLEDDWKLAEELLNMIMEDCLGNSLVTKIKDTLGDNKIKLQYTEEEGASYNLNTNTLSLGIGHLESNQAFHELWHAYQASRGTINSFGSSALNQEIEAHYAQYVYLSGKNWYAGSVYEKRYSYGDSRGTAVTNLEDHIDRKGNLLISGENGNILLDTYIETVVIPIFRNTPEYSTYPYDTNKNDISNFQNLNLLTINCN